MRPSLLLDTHVLMWWLLTPSKLSRPAYRSIQRADVRVSVISLWEISLKREHRKLSLPEGSLHSLVEAQQFQILPLHSAHVQAAADIGGLHADPYDRLLVGTARAEKMVFVTRDAALLERAAPLLGDLLLEA